MGKGDIRSKRGKIWRGTNGKTRPKARKQAKGKDAEGDRG
jgi:30S ribosomal protein S31